MVMTGKDKGKTGKVLRAFPARNLVIVDGVNKKKKHQKPSRSNQKGQVLDKMMPINVSNVMIVDPTTSKASRVGKKLVGERFVRISRKSGATLDNK